MKELKIIKMNVEGVKILTNKVEDKIVEIGIQLQVSEMIETKSGDMTEKINTVKVNKLFEKSELAPLIGKSIEITQENNLVEYSFDYGKKSYVCDGFKILDTKSKIDFNYNYGISGKISSVLSGTKKIKATGEEIQTTTFNIKYHKDLEVKIKSIKVLKEVKDYKKLVGKELTFNDIKSVKVDMNIYLSTETLPITK